MRRLLLAVLLTVLGIISTADSATADEDEMLVCPTRNSCYTSWGQCVVHYSGGCPNGCTTGEYSRCDAMLDACLGGEYCMPVY